MFTIKKIGNIILIISFILSFFPSSKDISEIPSSHKEQINEELVCAVTPDPPKYPGGDRAMLEFIYKNTKWPAISRENHHFLGSMIVIQFIIDEKGRPSDYRVLKSMHKDFDTAAITTLKQIKKWEPGRDIEGKPVKCFMTIPIRLCF